MRSNGSILEKGTNTWLKNVAIAAVGLLVSTAGARASVYNQVVSLGTLQGTTGGGTLASASIDGTTAYGLFTTPVISKVVNVDSSPTTSTETTGAAYSAASGGAGASGILWNLNSSTLVVADNVSRSIVKVDKASGTPSLFYSTAQIKAAANNDSNNPSLSQSAVSSAGDFYYYNATTTTASKGIYQTTGGALSVLLSNAALTTGMGNNAVSAFTFAGSNMVVIGNNTTHSIFGYNTTTSAFSSLLSTAQIAAVNGTASESFSATGFYYAPDGLVYYDEANSTTNKDIMSFDPLDPVNTLRTVYTGAQLLAGPAAATLVSNFTWYNGQIAWTEASASGVQQAGIYVAVPEPTSAAVLLLGSGLVCLRRRNKVAAPSAM